MTPSVVYRIPPFTENQLKVPNFLENFDEFVSLVDLLPGKILLLGDLNVHYDVPSKSDVRRFSTILASNGLVQHIIGPTHRCGHTLDLVITRQDEQLVKRYTIDREQFPKDHFMIVFLTYQNRQIRSRIPFASIKSLTMMSFQKT